MNWNNYYMEQAGNGSDYNYYRGSVYQQGYGMGSSFRKFFKWIVPIFKQHALPKIESGLKHVSREALSSAANIAKDYVAGKDLSLSAKEHVSTSIDKLKDKAERSLIGQGVKRKRKGIKTSTKFKKYFILKKQKKSHTADIFD